MLKLVGTRGRIADLQRYRGYPRYSAIKTRIDIVILAKKNLGPRKISRELGISTSMITKWVERYKAFGLEGLMDRPRPGSRKLLAAEKEDAFRTRVRNGPKEQDGVSRFTGEYLVKILKDEFNASYAPSGIYTLLKRLGLKKKT